MKAEETFGNFTSSCAGETCETHYNYTVRGITPRIQQLREQSLNAVNRISAERGLLMTEFYKNHLAFGDSIPVQRAKSLEYILSNKYICINDMELIVGERGPAPKATPTYPEITVHSLQDLEILDTREKVWFRVDEETKQAFADTIIPFWTNRSNRDRMMDAMSDRSENQVGTCYRQYPA
jgi:formate C-acetyltransferase